MRWGLGHSAGVGLIGLLSLWLRDWLPVDLLSTWGERLVGVMLFVVGWVLFVTMLFFSSLAFTVLENAMSLIFVHRVVIRRRHFLLSALLPLQRLTSAGHELAGKTIVTDDVEVIRAQVTSWAEDPDVDVIITTGGTGLGARDFRVPEDWRQLAPARRAVFFLVRQPQHWIASPLGGQFEVNRFVEHDLGARFADYRFEFLGRAKSMNETNSNFFVAFLLAFVFMYMVLAAQFESFRDPFIILVGSVPLAIAGALLFSFLGLTTLNIYSQVGLITLVGLVSKNGILIVEFANHLQETGMDKLGAIIEAFLLKRLYGRRSERDEGAGQLKLDFAQDPAAAEALTDAAEEAERIVQEYTVRRELRKKKPRNPRKLKSHNRPPRSRSPSKN